MDDIAGKSFRKSSRPWAVLVACFIIDMLGFTVPVTCFSVFVTPLMEAMSAPAASVLLYMTVMTLMSIPIMLFGGKLFQLGAGKVMAAAAVLIAVGFSLVATVQTLPMLYLAGICSGLAYPILSLFGVPVIIGNWFYKGAGTWTGVTLSASGLGGLILAPVVTSLIASAGWSNAMLFCAALMAVPFLLAVFVVRLNPLDMGILPYGATEEDVRKLQSAKAVKEDTSKTRVDLPGIDFKSAVKTPAFVFMLCAMFLIGCQGGYATQVNTLAQSAGYTAAAAGLAVSASSLGNLFSKPILGIVTDKVSAKTASLIGFGIFVVGMVCFVFAITANSMLLLIVSAVIGGLGGGAGIAIPPLFVRPAFGPKDFSTIYGVGMALRGLGTAVISPVCGAVYDVTGSYLGNVAIWAVASIIIIPFVFACVNKGRKLWAEDKAEA